MACMIFCPVDAVTTMSGYFGDAMPYFAAGVLTYYGKREQRKEIGALSSVYRCMWYAVFFLEPGNRRLD